MVPPQTYLFFGEFITKFVHSEQLCIRTHQRFLWVKNVKTTYWRRNISRMRTVKKGNIFPRKLVASQSLDIFKTRLDKSLSNLVQPHSWAYFEQEVGLETSWGPFQPALPDNPMIPVVFLGSSPVVPGASKVVERNAPVRKLKVQTWRLCPFVHQNNFFAALGLLQILQPAMLPLSWGLFAFSPKMHW